MAQSLVLVVTSLLMILKLDPTEAIEKNVEFKRKFVPPIFVRHIKSDLIYTHVKVVRYIVKSPKKIETKSQSNALLAYEVNDSEWDFRRIRINLERDSELPDWKADQIVESPLLNDEALKLLRVECLAQNVPVQNYVEIKNYFNDDLKLRNEMLRNIGQELMPASLDADWYVNTGLAHCVISHGDLVWTVWLLIRPKYIQWKILEITPISFRYYDSLCKSEIQSQRFIMGNNTLYELEIARVLDGKQRIVKALEIQERTQDNECVSAITLNNFEESKGSCLLRCGNSMLSSTNRQNDAILINSLNKALEHSCKSHKENISIPELGGMLIELQSDCQIELNNGEPTVYPYEYRENETEIIIVLPWTWVKTIDDKECSNWKLCLEEGVLKSEDFAVSSVANGPKVRRKPKNRIDFVFGEQNKNGIVNVKQSEIIEGYKNQCLIYMSMQMVVVSMTTIFLLAYARYHFCGVIATMVMMLHCVSGFGDVQIGPGKLLPDLPKVEFSDDRLVIATVAIMIIVAGGFSIGVLCCLVKCGNRRCGITA